MEMERKAIVRRHNPEFDRLDPLSPLSLGNGEFGFTADLTGLQTFPEQYEVPLGTQSNWGWHFTDGRGRFDWRDAALQMFDTHGRQVGYPMKPGDREEAYQWLRQNPHRLHLGGLSFRFFDEEGEELGFGDVGGFRQKLDLWTGVLSSRFDVRGVPVDVTTVCHPDADIVGVKVVSPLVRDGRLQVFIRFPAPDMTHASWAKSVHLDWGNDHRHDTVLLRHEEGSALIERTMDEDRYTVRWQWNGGRLEQTGTHELTLFPGGTDGSPAGELTFSVGFAPGTPTAAEVEAITAASTRHWEAFWQSGGAISFEGSSDPRAFELERRVVLSQWLCAVHSGGSIPPQETGLMYNSWFGKAHLEMHWWHVAHFALWGRASIMRRSLDWYAGILPIARELARSQGYEGARWPKMVGPDGHPCPSPVAPGLIWQQPHPIAMAELCYKAEPSMETLRRFRDIVFESADFMASYAHWNEAAGAFDLGPPLIPAQECHRMENSKNPPYELEYWKYGLDIAASWACRMGIRPNPRWVEVASKMASPPQMDGVYLAHALAADTFTAKNHDHPSMLCALGVLPGKLINRETMRRTLMKVKDEWQWETAWGWDFPVCAMTAARLGERDLAVDFLLMDEIKNTYLPNGHNYQRPGLSAYLPGNGGLLAAVAMMACGWEGQEDPGGPGFPSSGWNVRWEGLKPWL